VITFYYFEFVMINYLKYCFCRYIMNSIITMLYFNGRVYEENDSIIFEGSKIVIQIKHGISFNALKKKIGDKVKLENNEIIFAISCSFLVSGKYVALQICDDEDVETMLETTRSNVSSGIVHRKGCGWWFYVSLCKFSYIMWK